MNTLVKLSFVGAMALTLTACIQYRVPVYEAQANTLIELQQLSASPVALNPVSYAEGVTELRHCRTQGRVRTSGGDYAAYVERALRAELGLAGLLADEADVQLNATLQRMRFNSWNNSWDMVLDLQSTNGNSVTTHSTFKGNTASLEDDAACHLAAQAMPAAVRQLLHDALTSPEFESLLAASSAG